MLIVDAQVTTFPPTQMGESTSMRIAIRNDDRRRIVLDAITPTLRNPFDDFTVAQVSSLVFEPGQQREIVVTFRPSRAIQIEQKFRLDTSFGPAGPGAEIHVAGEGREGATGAAARIADQDYQRGLVDAERTKDVLPRDRENARTAVSSWAKDAIALDHSTADWMRNNWEHFLGQTGGHPHIAAPGIIMTQLKKVLTIGGAKAMEVVEVENPVAGFAIEVALHELSEFFVDKLLGSEEETPGESELAATEGVAKASIAKGTQLTAYRDKADRVIDDARSAAELRIAQATTKSELEKWTRWADIQQQRLPKPKDPADRSFATELLTEWTLQHAASPSVAGKDTNPAAWNKARGELKKSGELPTLERTDLFVHQCLREWGSLGLVGIEEAAAQLDRRRQEIEQEMRDARVSPNVTAAVIAKRLSTESVSFTRSSNPKQAAEGFASVDYQLAPDVDGMRIFGARFDLFCDVILNSQGAGVFVDHFTYDLSSRSPRSDSTDRHRDLRRSPK